MTTFFDTSAVIALADTAHANHAWSVSEFANRLGDGPVFISDVVYAEVSAGMPDQPAMDEIVARFGFQRSSPSDAALFRAGQRYKQYKQGSGTKTNVLPDFFIGADALEMQAALITANPKDFRSFFVGLEIVHPNGTETVQAPQT